MTATKVKIVKRHRRVC